MTDTATKEAPQPAKRWIGPLMVFIGAISIGFAPIGLRLGTETLGPQAIAFWRFSFAAPIVFALVLLVYRRLPVRPNKFVFIAGTLFALNVALWHWSLTLTTVANSTFVVSLGNISVGLLAWVFLKEKLTRTWMIAVVVAIIGALLLTQGGGESSAGNIKGDVIAIGAAIFVSGYALCAKIARREIGGLDVLFWVTVTEMLVQGLVVLVANEPFLPAESLGFKAPLMLAMIVQCVGQGFIITGLGRTPASIAGVLLLMQPITAAAISWRWFDEPLMALQIFGGALILAGVLLSQAGPRSQTVS